jgi:benzoate/toluate 1,2-dioxygenase reductase subunit
MTFTVALTFEDGITRFVDCGEDEKVADAAYRSRINIPLDCNDGACGTCKAFCESGSYDGGDYIDEALTDEEAASGFCLPCQITPHSDLILRIATTSDTAKTAAGEHSATISEIVRHSPSTVSVVIDVADRGALAFLPGQYVNITVPGTAEKRSYSFSAAPESDRLSFLVSIKPGGVMSDYLTERAAVGDVLDFVGPLGSFFLRAPSRPIVLIAGGSGLAPMLSILDRLERTESATPIHLMYGVSEEQDLVELDLLNRYTQSMPSFSFDYCVARPTGDTVKQGYVMDHLDPSHLGDGDIDVYVCGPPPMVDAVNGHLLDNHIVPVNLYSEKFIDAVRALA